MDTLKSIALAGIALSSSLILDTVTANPTQAATVYNATFITTANNTEFGVSYVDNVAFGDPFKVTIALNNGGDSLENQTWVAADIVSVTFDFNNGAHKTVFDPNGAGGNGLSTSGGSFVTNALGQLTAVPTDWTDASLVNVISTNSSQTPNAWFLNELNDKYYTDDFDFAVGIEPRDLNLEVAAWTIAPVPEPLTLLGASAAVAFGSAFKRKLTEKNQKLK